MMEKKISKIGGLESGMKERPCGPRDAFKRGQGRSVARRGEI